MFAVYFALGLLLLALVLMGRDKIKNISEENSKKTKKYLLIILAGVVILALLRFGQPLFALLFSAILASGPILHKVIRFIYTIRMFKGLFPNQGRSNQAKANTGKMTESQAREILGVSENATKKEIKDAYQNLMKKNHPDTGGSKYFAAQLNEAKDVLTKNKN